MNTLYVIIFYFFSKIFCDLFSIEWQSVLSSFVDWNGDEESRKITIISLTLYKNYQWLIFSQIRANLTKNGNLLER